jgi:hypothetical protein
MIVDGGLSIEEVWTQPEQDEWVYSNGKSLTSTAFTLNLLREAGIFSKKLF